MPTRYCFADSHRPCSRSGFPSACGSCRFLAAVFCDPACVECAGIVDSVSAESGGGFVCCADRDPDYVEAFDFHSARWLGYRRVRPTGERRSLCHRVEVRIVPTQSSFSFDFDKDGVSHAHKRSDDVSAAVSAILGDLDDSGLLDLGASFLQAYARTFLLSQLVNRGRGPFPLEDVSKEACDDVES